MKIRILERDNNARGDLFGHLMTDLFHCLGYTDCRLNVHKSGREVDIQGRHRVETRTVVAECKATKAPIGGSDVNKFAGALNAERIKATSDVAGYYVSLSGFTETAIEQELELGSRLQLITGAQAIEELIRGRVLIPEATAAARAGRQAPDSVTLIPHATELLAHELGWVWAFYFGNQSVPTHFCLVHADGEPLNDDLAQQIIASDKSLGGGLEELASIARPASMSSPEAALAKYREHLQVEYGSLTLEGLPADTQIGGKARRLESMFVPMDVERMGRGNAERAPFSSVLANEPRIAIVAAPGAGKSTLLKRLAVAYSSAGRISESSDNLPNEDWVPLVVRCRQLGKLSRKSILEIIESLPARAELPEATPQFMQAVTDRLKADGILLLIDGLDEISDEADRLAFATQLRTFLGTYPRARLVVTSREVGFRGVAGALSSSCSTYKLSELDDEDIGQLVSSWQAEFYGDEARARSAADDVIEDILSNDRVRALATNPLLLTTLLLVRRWLGELPRRRSALYGKAIEVLLMTWNVEGHEPLDQAEVLPQLSYVAFAMMTEGSQVVSAQRLAELLRNARREMPEELEGCRISVQDFVARVEERSSLLALAGHELIDGQLRAVYEFRHLTFQEYLAALGVVNGWHPGRTDDADFVRVLKPFLNKASWREVIPLVAVLAGRHSAAIVVAVAEELSAQLPESKTEDDILDSGPRSLAGVLRQCFADDAPITSVVATSAADALIRAKGLRSWRGPDDAFTGRHGRVLLEVASAGLLRFDDYAPEYGSVLGSAMLEVKFRDLNSVADLLTRISSTNDRKALVELLCAAMEIAYKSSVFGGSAPFEVKRREFRELAVSIHQVLQQNKGDLVVEFCGCWALAWLNTRVRWSAEARQEVFNTLSRIWIESDDVHRRRQAAWAVSAIRPLNRLEGRPAGLDAYLASAVVGTPNGLTTYFENAAIFTCRWVVGYYGSGADALEDFEALLKERRHNAVQVVKALRRARFDVRVLSDALERRQSRDIDSGRAGEPEIESLPELAGD